MRRLFQNNIQDMTAEMLQEYRTPFRAVCVDIGTGDGKRLYRVAREHTDTLYIGIDPVKENMQETAKKISKKKEKGGLDNLLLVIGAVEALPSELDGMADEITVYFPWGSLLEGVIKPVPDSMREIRRIAKDGAEFIFVTTYQNSYEANEIEKRGLPELNREYFETVYTGRLQELGFRLESVSELDPEEIRAIGTQWAKRLGTGRARQYYMIRGRIGSLNGEER